MVFEMMHTWLAIALQTVEHSEGAAPAHHVPFIVERVNHLLGPAVYNIQKAIMPSFYGLFGAEWHGDPNMPIPTHIVMFFIAVIIATVGLRLIRGKLSLESPSNRQQFFELLFGGLRGLIRENIGTHGARYFPVIATFAILIGTCNLMGLIPGLEAPTANFNVPLALALMSFLYYNYVGIRENGLVGYLRHFAGPVLAIAPLFFPVEIVSNTARIVSLSMRLFWNIFGDETLGKAFAQIGAWGLPAVLMPLALFVALMQTFIFVMLSVIYISEVTHHEEASVSRAELHEAHVEA
jgi:F-type H+-transporting ATPase subunit a